MLQRFLVNDTCKDRLNSLTGSKFDFIFLFSDLTDESLGKIYVMNWLIPNWSAYSEWAITYFTTRWYCYSWKSNPVYLLAVWFLSFGFLLGYLFVSCTMLFPLHFVLLILTCFSVGLDNLLYFSAQWLHVVCFTINTLVDR